MQDASKIDFEKVFKEHYRSTFAFFFSQGASIEDSHDLTQDTFFRVYRGYPSFRGDTVVKGWIKKIAANVWRNELRRRGALKRDVSEISLEHLRVTFAELELYDPPDDSSASCPEVRALVSEEVAILSHALDQLPKRMRRVAKMRFVQEYQYSEIACLLRISIQTVKSQLFQARERLQEELRRNLTTSRKVQGS